MESILFLIIFLVFRAIGSQLFESQKSQNDSKPRTSIKPKKITQSHQSAKPKIIPIKEFETIKIEPDISDTSIEEQNHLQKRITQPDVLENNLESETIDHIPELFTQENILRGIILQEILSPPKALMRRWR